jgi:trk system potassium uptake protein TrkH
MGVLVFILAIIPESKDGSSMHILRAESPGPQVGKLVSKMRVTSRILYLIYLVLTIIQFLFLWLGPDKQMTAFNSIIFTCTIPSSYVL